MESGMERRLIALAGVLAAAAGLSACAYDEAYYGPPAVYADMDYEAWYDGFYGPFHGGFWGPGGRFYYWDQAHRHYHRDAGHHFARSDMPGFNSVHGRSPPPAGAHGRAPKGPR
jgi:hypothetical protein